MIVRAFLQFLCNGNITADSVDFNMRNARLGDPRRSAAPRRRDC